MGLRVSGKNMDVGEALRATAEARVAAALAKYATRGHEHVPGTIPAVKHDGHVVLERDGFGYRADCVIHLNGVTLHATALAADAYQSFERCAERIEKRLRRHGRRLKDRREGKEAAGRAAGPDGAGLDAGVVPGADGADADLVRRVVLSVPDDAFDDEEDADGAEPDADGGAPEPMIIAESTERLPAWSVREAVEELDLTGAPLVVFRHAGSERINIVYRRHDGHVGWVDPGGTAGGA